MDVNEYVKLAARTNAPLDSDDENIHMILGMLTEVGELADVFKKNMAYNKPIDWVNVEEELGDLLWYVACFCDMNTLDLENIMKKNINKLRVRYPEKFTEEKAKNRDLKTERKLLED